MYYTPKRGRAGVEELDRTAQGLFGGCIRPRCTSAYDSSLGDDIFTLLIDARCIGFEGKWKKSFQFNDENGNKNIEDLCCMLHRYFKLDVGQRILVQVYDEQFEEYVVRQQQK
jgi:hypothetical protein